MYFRSNVVKQFGDCEYCGRYAKQSSYRAQKFGHLYFIPLIPLGAKSQVLNECSACDMGAHLPLTDAEPMIQSLRERFKGWVIEIQEGKTEIVPEGQTEPVNVGLLIAGMVETMYSLNEIQDIESISQILLGSDLEFENCLVMARWSEMQGKLAETSKHYQAAHRLQADHPVPLYQWGRAEMRQGNTASAETAFHKYLDVFPDDINAYVELAAMYEGQKDFAKIVRTYDKLYGMNPALLAEKPMKKLYKKACKKSGTQGAYLNQV